MAKLPEAPPPRPAAPPPALAPEMPVVQQGPIGPIGQSGNGGPLIRAGSAQPVRLPPIGPLPLMVNTPSADSTTSKSPPEIRYPNVPLQAAAAPKINPPAAPPKAAPSAEKPPETPPPQVLAGAKPDPAEETGRANAPPPKQVEKAVAGEKPADINTSVVQAAMVGTQDLEQKTHERSVAKQAVANEPVPNPKSKIQSATGGPKSAVQPADYEARGFALQPPALAPLRPIEEEPSILPAGSPFEAVQQSGVVKLRVRRSILLRTKVDIYRTAIVDETVCDIVQFTPREVSIIGRAVGQTHVTFWLDDPATAPLTYLVEVQPDPQQIKADESKYELLQNVVNEMFPDSKIHLVLVADKLLVKGQAKDSEEAAQIMTIVRAQVAGAAAVGYGGGLGGLGGFGLAQGLATPVLPNAATGGNSGPAYQVINMLRVPGVQQVALKVKIAELNRTRARGFGIDARAAINFSDSAKATQLFLASLLNASNANSTTTASNSGTAVVTSFGGQEVNLGLRYLQEQGVIRLLSEPTLVTLSGRPATFIAGGEFAVPTIVGSVGLNAVTTDFRAFGAIISFLPTIVDKDRIRLQVAPEFSQINNGLRSANNTPGLNVRAATTTVEMREGQTLAIAGLLEDSYKATNVGDLPGLAKIFGRRDTARNETELIILVTPELVHPMEPEEVPPLPGFDVTEPTGSQFFLHGEIEGNPTQDYRSTVWPRLRRRYGMGGPAMTSGPFGHGQ